MEMLKFSAEYPCWVRVAAYYGGIRGRELRKKVVHVHVKIM